MYYFSDVPQKSSHRKAQKTLKKKPLKRSRKEKSKNK